MTENAPWKTDMLGNPLTDPVHAFSPFKVRRGTMQDDLFFMFARIGYNSQDVPSHVEGVALTAAQRAMYRNLRANPDGVISLEAAIREGMQDQVYRDGNVDEHTNIYPALYAVTVGLQSIS